jgi:hypothetical protein
VSADGVRSLEVNRALIVVVAVVGLAGLTGCGVLTGMFGVARPTGPPDRHVPTVTGPMGPVMTGGPRPPTGPNGPELLAGMGDLTDSMNNSYVAYGVALVSGTESTVEIPVPVAGTLSDLQVRVTTAPRTGASWTFTVDKNGSATGMSCAIEEVATTCNDSSLVAVAVGDKIDLDVTPFGTPALATVIWSAKITR